MVCQACCQLGGEHHGDRILRRFERDIFPWIGGKPIADVNTAELPSVVRRIETRGALETAHRALGNCGQVFRTGRAMRDPTGDLRGALAPVKGEHFAAVTEPKQAAELLRTIDGYQGTFTVACALRLWCSYALASFARRNGRTLILMRRNGAIP
jgi:integrase